MESCSCEGEVGRLLGAHTALPTTWQQSQLTKSEALRIKVEQECSKKARGAGSWVPLRAGASLHDGVMDTIWSLKEQKKTCQRVANRGRARLKVEASSPPFAHLLYIVKFNWPLPSASFEYNPSFLKKYAYTWHQDSFCSLRINHQASDIKAALENTDSEIRLHIGCCSKSKGIFLHQQKISCRFAVR